MLNGMLQSVSFECFGVFLVAFASAFFFSSSICNYGLILLAVLVCCLFTGKSPNNIHILKIIIEETSFQLWNCKL